MKKIIVPVDFSEYSENALKTAVFLAKKQSAEILTVHMLELSNALVTQSESFLQEQTIFYLKLAEKKFKELLDKDYLQGVKVTPIIKHHKFFEELNQLAKEVGADLIVMGSQGATGLKEMFVGSNTEKVVRTSDVPVLVVKGLSATENFKNAVFACDFSDDDIHPYLEAKELLKKMNCNMHLLHVNTPYAKFMSSQEQRNKVANFLNKAGDDLNNDDIVFVSDYTVEEGILAHATSSNVDLIIMATHGRRGVSHFLEGSISEDVANHSTLPVMTFKIQESKKAYWTNQEFKTYLFIYCMNADFKETKEELDMLRFKLPDSKVYSKIHAEFEQDNDYQSIQKIKNAIDKLGYSAEDVDKLFVDVKDLFLSDGKFDVLEQNLMMGLKRLL